jgi:hypothetical protein
LLGRRIVADQIMGQTAIGLQFGAQGAALCRLLIPEMAPTGSSARILVSARAAATRGLPGDAFSARA